MLLMLWKTSKGKVTVMEMVMAMEMMTVEMVMAKGLHKAP